MPPERFVEALNEQIGNEFAPISSTSRSPFIRRPDAAPPRRLFFAQALEERDHAMMMVQYLLDADAEVKVPASARPSPPSRTSSSPLRHALEAGAHGDPAEAAMAATG